jgi:hypothetical protein
MNLDSLSDVDKAVLGKVLRAAADGPFFPDWKFQTLFGLGGGEVRAIVDAWPKPTASAEKVGIALNNSLGNLLGYPHHQDAAWSQWLPVDRDQLNELFVRLRGLN